MYGILLEHHKVFRWELIWLLMYAINWSQDQTMIFEKFLNGAFRLLTANLSFRSPQFSELFKDFDHKSDTNFPLAAVDFKQVCGFSAWELLFSISLWLLCIVRFPHTNELFPTHLAAVDLLACAFHIWWIRQPWNATGLLGLIWAKLWDALTVMRRAFLNLLFQQNRLFFVSCQHALAASVDYALQ